ncbi:hypothetical protein DL93DRAFT_2101469 [Clavulina sp. PMI_390]|nr:hypothetical protein DL93DRAFT_2101469 [Clavulina sp. PMI_390]
MLSYQGIQEVAIYSPRVLENIVICFANNHCDSPTVLGKILHRSKSLLFDLDLTIYVDGVRVDDYKLYDAAGSNYPSHSRSRLGLPPAQGREICWCRSQPARRPQERLGTIVNKHGSRGDCFSSRERQNGGTNLGTRAPLRSSGKFDTLYMTYGAYHRTALNHLCQLFQEL